MKRKKTVAVFLAAAMMVSLSTGIAFANTDRFTDINEHWARSIINEAAGLGIVGGYPEGDFKPDTLMKREEFFKLVSNVLTAQPDTSATTIAFSDVNPIEWYVPVVKTAVASGITNGYEDGTFGIGIMVSRQEAAKVIASIIPADNLDSGKSLSQMKDAAQIGDWAKSYVEIMYKKGYMQGDTDGLFRPTSALTRAEAATILLNVKKNETSILGPNQKQNQVIDTTPSAIDEEVIGSEGGCIVSVSHKAEDGAFARGSGSARDPYVVSTPEQLNHMRQHLDKSEFFILKNDIDVDEDFATSPLAAGASDADWSSGNFEPIGTPGKPFDGNLDGNGKTISGLKIGGTVKGDSSSRITANYAGLFGYIDERGSVEDLKIDDSTVNGRQYTGAIAAYSNGTITGCTLGSDGKVSGNTNTGGIVGYAKTVLENNTNLGTVEGTTNTGGIAGSFYGTGEALIECENKGSVKGNDKTGGVAGYVAGSGSAVTVKACNNSGNVTVGPYNAGGIVGVTDSKNYSVTLTNCHNSGEVSGNGVIGGIVGHTKGSKSSVKLCYNSGEVDGSSAGGVVGNNEGTIEYSASAGDITGTVAAGGIAAYQEKDLGRITRSYNDGDIDSTSFAGGIIGTNANKVNNCYNTGDISGTNSIGGIVGKNEGTIDNVYNVGDVSASNGEGGLAGRNIRELTAGYWLEGTCSDVIGLTDTGSTQNTKKLTSEQLSGEETFKTVKGYESIVDVMNATAGGDVWELVSGSYKYPGIVDLRR